MTYDREQVRRMMTFTAYIKAHAAVIASLAADGNEEAVETLAGLLDGLVFARRSSAGKTSGGESYERAYKIALSLLKGEALARLLGVPETTLTNYGKE